jgi:hypothetical protein
MVGLLDKEKEFLIRFIKYDGDSQKGFILKAICPKQARIPIVPFHYIRAIRFEN